MQRLVVYAQASKKEHIHHLSKKDKEMDALKWLQKNDYPIASSCDGEGICKKCIINENLLACQVKMKDLTSITISYI